MRTALFLLAFLAVPALAGQTVWKWVDEQGVLHFSDRPVPGAAKVELASGSRADAVASPPISSSSSEGQRPVPGPVYRTLEITQPAQGESIINTSGRVTVTVNVEPGLQPGHQLTLYLDGSQVQGFPPNANSYELKDVPRGEHRLTASISDGRGARVQQSGAVTFSVRQESIAKPPVGPALRTPPKPRPRAANKLPTQQPSYAALNSVRTPIDPATNLPVRNTKPATPSPPASTKRD
ncbi:MAG TPA: DUF4124 domain-containing protein [Steroidobacter sp.]|nr:DUF4124 domain-containing protein [Steroidobacter sp.]